MERDPRVVISGGGTGGHIFPAISIANAVKAARPGADILFVGALGRMEMERVPEAGYPIVGLPISGFDRKHLLRNIPVLFKIWKSRRMARKIIRDFKPDVAVGVGGYASGPTLNVCAGMGIPYLLQEQNSYAGVTNKLLAKKAAAVCVAYEGMGRFFPEDKIMLTGNPVRENVVDCTMDKSVARAAFGLDVDKPTVLVVGGSLGAKTLNASIVSGLDKIRESGVQFLVQTGKRYGGEVREAVAKAVAVPNLHMVEFISDMGAAYKAADLVVSRAGAGSISELCLAGKPVILVPSPNVAEDHQTKNAMALVDRDAAVYVKDSEAEDLLVGRAVGLVKDAGKLASLGANISAMALKDSAQAIAREVIRLAEKGNKQW